MANQHTQHAVQAMLQSRREQLVNITNKIPALVRRKLVSSPQKVPKVMKGRAMVTGITLEKERERLAVEGGWFTPSLADLQPFEIDPEDSEEPPKFEPIQVLP